MPNEHDEKQLDALSETEDQAPAGSPDDAGTATLIEAGESEEGADPLAMLSALVQPVASALEVSSANELEKSKVALAREKQAFEFQDRDRAREHKTKQSVVLMIGGFGLLLLVFTGVLMLINPAVGVELFKHLLSGVVGAFGGAGFMKHSIAKDTQAKRKLLNG